MTVNESLMTAAAPTNSAAVATKEAAPVAAAVPAQEQPAAPAAATASPDAVTDAAKAPEAKAGAPEKYEFKAPEGRDFDNEVISTYSEIARELNLSQESAQLMLDRLGPKVAERQMAQIESIRQGWVDAARVDKEFGGDALGQSLATAKKALDAFGTAELRNVLNQSGLGNHPELIRFFWRAGKAISEDTHVGPSTGGGAKAQPRDFASQAAALYSNQP